MKDLVEAIKTIKAYNDMKFPDFVKEIEQYLNKKCEDEMVKEWGMTGLNNNLFFTLEGYYDKVDDKIDIVNYAAKSVLLSMLKDSMMPGVVNEHKPEHVLTIDQICRSTEGDEEVEFCFRVEHDTDVLCSYEVKGNLYALLTLRKHDDLKGWRDIHTNYLQHCIDKTKEDKGGYVSPHIFGYDLSIPCKELPYRLWIGGCDDSSYAVCFATMKEAVCVINVIKTEKVICSKSLVKDFNMVFTN